MAGELLDADYFYLFYIPVLLSVAATIVRRKSLRVWVVLFVLATFVLSVLQASRLTNTNGLIQNSFAILLFSILPPLILGFTLRLGLFTKKPFLVLVAGPLLFLGAFVLAVNLWLLLGFPL